MIGISNRFSFHPVESGIEDRTEGTTTGNYFHIMMLNQSIIKIQRQETINGEL